MAVPPPPPQWVLDLNSTAPLKPKNSSLPDPPGYTPPAAISKSGNKGKNVAATARKPPTIEEMDMLKLKKAWEIAIAPAKALPMNAFGMYMSGNSLQIFSIMMVFMLFKNPVTALMSMQSTFARYETEGTKNNMLLVKLAFIACNLLAVGLGLWKVNGMGLLP